jgi:hypothetical protein
MAVAGRQVESSTALHNIAERTTQYSTAPHNKAKRTTYCSAERGLWYLALCTHTRTLPRVVKGDRKGLHRIRYSVRQFLKTSYVISPTHGCTGGVVFRIDFRINGG